VNNAKRRIGLAWFAATDNVGIAGYRVYRDGGLVGSPSGTSFADGSVTDALPHTYFVTAVDAAGNESAASNSVTAALSGKGNGRK
jgi:chitodextrinase